MRLSSSDSTRPYVAVVSPAPIRAAVLGVVTALFALQSLSQTYWLPVDKPTPHNLKAVYFTDSLHGWIGGDSGVIISTADGGASWSVQRGADSVYVTDIFMLDTLRGWVSAIRPLVSPGDWNGSVLYRTTDGGLTWPEQAYPGQFFNTLFFFDSLEGWIGGETGLLLGTTDGGDSWSGPSIQDTIFSAFPVKRIRFFSRDYGYAVGGYPESAGVIWRTVDGGGYWSVSGLGDALRAIHYVDSMNVFLLGGGFDDGACVTRTTDGGASWSFSYVGPFGFATAMAVRDASEWWVPLAFAGTSMYTLDAGGSWTEYQNPGSLPSYGIAFPDPRHGFMVGDSGLVLVYNTPVAVDVVPQWNIISLPVGPENAFKDSLFPPAVSPAYAYGPGGYAVEETLTAGKGYWLKFSAAERFEFYGLPRTSDSVGVEEGWNMIGALSVPLDVSAVASVPPGIIASGFYEFGNGYSTVPELLPGKGYWVKVSAAGTIILSAPSD